MVEGGRGKGSGRCVRVQPAAAPLKGRPRRRHLGGFRVRVWGAKSARARLSVSFCARFSISVLRAMAASSAARRAAPSAVCALSSAASAWQLRSRMSARSVSAAWLWGFWWGGGVFGGLRLRV